MSKKVVFPSMSAFTDLFVSASPPEGDAPVLLSVPAWDGTSRFRLVGYLMTSDHKSMHVRAGPEVLAYVKDHVLHCGNDRMYFEIVIRSGGKSLVVAQHNVICGNHWLAEIDTDTIPGIWNPQEKGGAQ